MSPILTKAIATACSLTTAKAAALLPLAQAGDAAAHLALVEDCYPYIGRIAARFPATPGYEADDLFAVGVESVCHTIRNYRKDAPAKLFRSFARRYIPATIRAYADDHAHTIKLAERLRIQRTPTGEAVFKPHQMVPLDESLADPAEAEPSAAAEHGLLLELLDKALFQGLVSGRERAILYRRFGLDGAAPERLIEIAESYGCSHQNILQIELRAVTKLRVLLGLAE